MAELRLWLNLSIVGFNGFDRAFGRRLAVLLAVFCRSCAGLWAADEDGKGFESGVGVAIGCF